MFEVSADIPYNNNGIIDEMPFASLEIGQSFFIPAEADADGNYNTNTKMNLVMKARKVYPEKYLAAKKVEENGVIGIRVWSLDPATKPAPRKKPATKKVAAKAA